MSILSSTAAGGHSFPITENELKKQGFEYQMFNDNTTPHAREILNEIHLQVPDVYINTYTLMIQKSNDWLGIVTVSAQEDGSTKEYHYAFFAPDFQNITLRPTVTGMRQQDFAALVQDWLNYITPLLLKRKS